MNAMSILPVCVILFLDLVVLGLKPLLTSQPYYKVERKTVGNNNNASFIAGVSKLYIPFRIIHPNI